MAKKVKRKPTTSDLVARVDTLETYVKQLTSLVNDLLGVMEGLKMETSERFDTLKANFDQRLQNNTDAIRRVGLFR